jgi:acyl-coenzyme A synthetase/AMP-(fatty) acid ligase
MNILVIDGMGGGMGKSIIERLRSELLDVEIGAVGTNALATSNMMKAGANYGATGENAVLYNCTKADYIVGTMGIIIGNSMHGEISPRMAEAIASSPAHKILIPIDKCNVTVVGAAEKTIQAYMAEIAEIAKKIAIEN